MATWLKVPILEMDMEEAGINRWLVSEGDEVKKGDPVLELETDKTSIEVEANADGIIRSLQAEAGDTVAVRTEIACIVAPGEEVPELEKPGAEGAGEEPEREDETASATAGAATSGDSPASVSESPSADGRKLRASPAARRAASERGVPLEEVPGSGPAGRVYLSDVLEIESQEEAPAAAEAPAPPTEESPATDEVRREPLSRIRRVGAEQTARSFSEVPHFYLTRELEAERILELAGRLKERMDPAPSINELLALAVARTLRGHPRLNARYAGDELEINERVNLGVAVSTEEGLVVPVLKNADTLPLRELAPAMKDLVGRARDGQLSYEDISGGTFTISNLGMMGVDSFGAIINQPEAAVLAVGRVRTVPEWQEGAWVPRQVISSTLSVDHRAADGADGAAFLEGLQAALSDWELLL